MIFRTGTATRTTKESKTRERYALIEHAFMPRKLIGWNGLCVSELVSELVGLELGLIPRQYQRNNT
ncbi:hypothetical protein [Staphylococcus saprophyticus]|uniref:hypothetical protein n=1 Tax=Staphylococcus saprophyticus TaxID=29385 RepID=UPI00289B91BC|nr:hypothetical protein [Staphylococcus saprophyticus]